MRNGAEEPAGLSTHRQPSARRELIAATAGYVVTLTLILIASLLPEYRVWGLNWWAYFPSYVPPVLFGLGLLAAAGILRLPINDTIGGRRFAVLVPVTSIALLALFVLFRARTHFLGDGLNLLSDISSAHPFLKSSNLGAMLVHLSVRDLIGGPDEASARLAIQIVAYVSGLIMLITAAVAAWRWSDRFWARAGIFLTLASGGYLLLAFGYVENYSLLIAFAGVFALVGCEISEGRLSRWTIVPPLIVILFLHRAGVLFLPAAVLVLLRRDGSARLMAFLSRKWGLAVAALIAIGGVAGLYLLQQQSLVLRFIAIPVVTDRFTSDGYTMFSAPHLIDLVNLILLLVPGVLVIGAALLMRRGDATVRCGNGLAFLAVHTLVLLAALLVFDPQLGMARDWDLLSFSGPSLAMLGVLLVIRREQNHKAAVRVLMLAAALGFLVLLPRAAALAEPEIGIAHFRNYVELAPDRNANSRARLAQYYAGQGDNATAQRVYREFFLDRCPFVAQLEEALALRRKGKNLAALDLLRRVRKQNPALWPVYGDLGDVFFALDQTDSALFYLQVQDAFHSAGPKGWTLLAVCLLRLNRTEEAVGYLERAVDGDSDLTMARSQLAGAYLRMGRMDDSYRTFGDLCRRGDASPDTFRKLGEAYLARGHRQYAEEALAEAVRRGADSSLLRQLDRSP